MLPSILLLTLPSLAIAAKTPRKNFSGPRGRQNNLLLPGTNSQAFNFLLSGTCNAGEDICENTCIPSDGTCCDEGNGAYCKSGYYCNSDGCCPNGKVCSGPASGCSDDEETCNGFCVPQGSVCCDTGYCDAGETCTSDGFCSSGSGNNGSGSGNCYSYQETCGDGCMPQGDVCCDNGHYCYKDETCESDGTCSLNSSDSGNDNNDDDGDSDGNCYSFQEPCGDGCMPKGSVCCDNGHYCFSGETCESGGTCQYGSDSGDSFTTSAATTAVARPTGPMSGGDDDGDSSTTSATITTAARPTGPMSGGDDDDDSSSSNSDSDGAASVNIPNAFVGLLALVPLVL